MKVPSRAAEKATVVRNVEVYHGLQEKSIKGSCRAKNYVKARRILYYILREHYKMSYPEIASFTNKSSHQGVIYGLNKITEMDKRVGDLLYYSSTCAKLNVFQRIKLWWNKNYV